MNPISTLPPCTLGLTADDLSAWRDHYLSATDIARMTEHVYGCRACQRIIAADETLASVLLADQPPAPDPRNWPRLHARIAGASPAASVQRPVAPSPRCGRAAVWSSVGAVAAVLLISALFFRLFGEQAVLRQGKTAHKTTPAGTPAPLVAVAPTTPITGHPLAWQGRNAPASVVPPPGNQSLTNGITVAPSDARTAYICAAANTAGSNPVAIWATHDGAQTWAHMTDVPNTGSVAECSMIVDAHNPERLSLYISGQDTRTFKSLLLSYISDDGGRTWRRINDDVILLGLSTSGNTGVAVVRPMDSLAGYVPSGAKPRESRLAVSHDDFHTWQPIDGQFDPQTEIVSQVWQRPGDGALLADVATRHASAAGTPSSTSGVASPFPYTFQLWQSNDLGAHWTPFPEPANLADSSPVFYSPYLVAEPSGSEPWRVCSVAAPSATGQHDSLLGCTLDGGATWTSRPLPKPSGACDASCVTQQVGAISQARLLSDGTLIGDFSIVASPGKYSDFHVLRLTPGTAQWQDLGPLPGNGVIIAGNSPDSAVVSYSGSGSLDGYSGQIVGHLGGDIPNRGALAYAALP